MRLESFAPVVIVLLVTAVVYLLTRAAKKPAIRKGNRRTFSLGIGFKVFAVLLVPASLFVAYAASRAHPSQVVIAFIVASGFLASAIFSIYQAFFVLFEYDDQNIYYRSPLAGSHVIPWSEVLEVGYSGLLQAYFLRTNQVRRIWCSSMHRGFDELGEFLSRKLEELYGTDP